MFDPKKQAIHLALVLFVLVSAFAPLAQAKETEGHRPVKNIIVMISDGMGYNHTMAASMYRFGKAGAQIYELFPFKSGMSTYAAAGSMGAPASDLCAGWSYDPAQAWSNFDYLKRCPTDSASAATAMSTGIKTYNAGIGVDVNGNPVQHALEMAEAHGKATGVVTTVEFSHATPAGFVAHNISRNNYTALGAEMVMNSSIDVIMGAGNPWFNDSGQPVTTANNYQYVGGQATWDALVAGTAGNDADGDGDFDAWTLIQTRKEFQNLKSGPAPDRLIGVAQAFTTLQQNRGGDKLAEPYEVPSNSNVPTLAEMSQAALNVLDNDPDGLFLMIEGGAVDWAAHANQSGRQIEEQIDFDKAVKWVMHWVETNSNWEETLLIVTGDHETGYLWGPGSNPGWEPLTNNGKGVLPGMQWNSGDHTNSLIPFYATGRAAQMFADYAVNSDPVRGMYIDNTNIAQVIFTLLGE